MDSCQYIIKYPIIYLFILHFITKRFLENLHIHTHPLPPIPPPPHKKIDEEVSQKENKVRRKITRPVWIG